MTTWKELNKAYLKGELEALPISELLRCKEILEAARKSPGIFAPRLAPISKELDRLVEKHHQEAKEERPHADAERRHQETLDVNRTALEISEQANRISREANIISTQSNKLSRWAFVISIVAALFAGFQAFYPLATSSNAERNKSKERPRSDTKAAQPISSGIQMTNALTNTNQPPQPVPQTNQASRIP